VSFTDLSSGDIDEWAWDFGDGGTSTLQHPTHEYTAAGDYTVSLTVAGPGGSDTHEEIDYINVTPPAPPVADFIGTPTTGDALLNVSFTDESTGVITDWDWEFGDGGTSTLQNPSHIYKDVGDYTVSLTVTGPGGSHTMTKTNYVQVTGPPKRVYLPLILRAYAPPVPDDPVVNGDFEDGPVAWEESSLYLYPIVVNWEEYEVPVQPHSGDWLAWLGGAPYELAHIQQPAAIPSGRSYLHFWHWLYSYNAACTTDRARLEVDGTEVKTYLLCTSTGTGGWVEQVVDLSAYAGQSVVLRFSIETGAEVSGWYVDDVSFEVSAATADLGFPVAPDPGIGNGEMVRPAPDLKP
jgi:PKD repeat protein